MQYTKQIVNGKWQHLCVFTDMKQKCSGFILNNPTGSVRLCTINQNGWCEINYILYKSTTRYSPSTKM